MSNLILIVMCVGIGFWFGYRYAKKSNYNNYKNNNNSYKKRY